MAENKQTEDKNDNKKKKKGGGIAQTVLLIVAIAVFVISGVQLLGILKNYQDSNNEYEEIADDFTEPLVTPGISSEVPVSSSAATTDSAAPEAEAVEQTWPAIEDADPPLAVNFAALEAINSDIVGWIYVDGEPRINYPILHAEDNDYYLHRTFRKEHKYAGSIFMECSNNTDFADPDTIIYGHNMRNGSMFGLLKLLAGKYESHPYFWILTPKGSYRYHIYAIFKTKVNSSVYTLWPDNNDEFLQWEKNLQKASSVPNNVPLTKDDKTVILSTCTSDKSQRTVVIGKCVSTAKPTRENVTPAAETPTETPAA
ncbi:MAG: class B sortase [Lachnospiraceae bacterium]|nr:class B sortase [Lachnospiraceae bacterium]